MVSRLGGIIKMFYFIHLVLPVISILLFAGLLYFIIAKIFHPSKKFTYFQSVGVIALGIFFEGMMGLIFYLLSKI